MSGKLKNIQCSDTFASELEIEVMRDFEGFVQDKLAAYRDTLEDLSEDYSDVYENQDLYGTRRIC